MNAAEWDMEVVAKNIIQSSSEKENSWFLTLFRDSNPDVGQQSLCQFHTCSKTDLLLIGSYTTKTITNLVPPKFVFKLAYEQTSVHCAFFQYHYVAFLSHVAAKRYDAPA